MTPYFYHFKVTRVIDGDTVDGRIDLGFRIGWDTRVRFQFIDTPETRRPVNEQEREAGKRCTEFLTNLVESHKGNLYLQSNSIDLYARCVGTLYFKNSDGSFTSVTQLMREYMDENSLNKSDVRS